MDSRVLKKIWVTKYALTGVFTGMGEIRDTSCWFKREGGYCGMHLYRRKDGCHDYVETLQEAIVVAEKMVVKRIKSLEKQIAKLRNFQLKVTDDLAAPAESTQC